MSGGNVANLDRSSRLAFVRFFPPDFDGLLWARYLFILIATKEEEKG